MNKNIRRPIFFFLLILAVISATVYAHPGRTDGAGGHTNHSTGEYHYHHGYSEHQHYDMDGDGILDCPFSFNKNTEKVQKDNETSNKNNSFTDEYNSLREQQSGIETGDDVTTGKTNTDTEKKKPDAKEIIGTILVIVIFGPLALSVVLSIMSAMLSEVRDLIQKLKKK